MALHEAMRPRSGLEPIEPLLDVSKAAHLLGHFGQDLARLDPGP